MIFELYGIYKVEKIFFEILWYKLNFKKDEVYRNL